MIKKLIIVGFILLAFHSEAQFGYIGNKSVVSFGITSNYGLIKQSKGQYNYISDSSLCLPKFSIGLQRENKKGRVIYLEGAYQQLPNSLMQTRTMVPDPSVSYGLHNTYYYDSLFTRSDNIKFTYGIRSFRELSPLGLYFDFRMSLNSVVNKSLLKSTRVIYYDDYNYTYNSETRITRSGLVFLPEIGFGIGKIVPINKRTAFDYGARFNLVFGKYRNKNAGSDPRIEVLSISHQIVSSKKLTTANLIEVYASFNIFH